ncbi:MAG: hypothetical protein M1818_000380 [Claussenomyces sp. TS43310]|nr:MAG: hypothetical protein M1818_000380 [Claussenomyces sp. TS43310]
MSRTLSGGCSCGRNHYTVHLPADVTDDAQVFFDDSHSRRRDTAALLSAYLRVPLPWVHSTTYAFFPDETHHSIRRVYTSPSDTASKRHFCGFCGTPLSHWTESPRREADYIYLTLGSLAGNDLQDLEELGLLPQELAADNDDDVQEASDVQGAAQSVSLGRGVPWFESLVRGTGLGRVKRSIGSSRDGSTRVDWEVFEWTNGDDAQPANVVGKRKLETLEGGDSIMEGLH